MPRPGARVKGDAQARSCARDRLRGELLAAARSLAAEQGDFTGITMRAVAERIGYTAPVVYQYFGSKHALLAGLVDLGFAELSQALGAAQCPKRGQLTPLHAVAEAYWDFAIAEPTLYRLMHDLPGLRFGTPDAPAAAIDCFQQIKAVAAGACDPAADPDAAADLLWAQLHGLVSLALADRMKGGLSRGRELLSGLSQRPSKAGHP